MIDLNTLFIVTAGLSALTLFLLVKLILNERKLRKLLSGKTGRDLEGTITENISSIRKMDNRILLIAQEIDEINKRLAKATQKIHTVRFNPFRDQGGNQSFATAFLNESDDGVVISSIYSRDKVSVYAKPVAGGKSEYELSNEEREAIEKAGK